MEINLQVKTLAILIYITYEPTYNILTKRKFFKLQQFLFSLFDLNNNITKQLRHKIL